MHVNDNKFVVAARHRRGVVGRRLQRHRGAQLGHLKEKEEAGSTR
jgi:hypothetical protein